MYAKRLYTSLVGAGLTVVTPRKERMSTMKQAALKWDERYCYAVAPGEKSKCREVNIEACSALFAW